MQFAIREEVIRHDLRIVPDESVTLNDPCNLAHLEAFVHTSPDLCVFIAVTASSSTLDDILDMVKLGNDRQQRVLDEIEMAPPCSLDLPMSPIQSTNLSRYILNIFSLEALSSRSVVPETEPVASRDRYLRDTPDPNSPRLPPFHHGSNDRGVAMRINNFPRDPKCRHQISRAKGEAIAARIQASRRRSEGNAAEPSPAEFIESV